MANEDNALSDSLVYLVAGYGGNNYWARTINGCDKIYTKGTNTLSVSVSPRGRYVLMCDLNFFGRCSAKMQKLVLIHEAGHLALRHIERFIRILSMVTDPLVRFAVLEVFNYAADFADNDSIVRNEPEFAECHLPKDQNPLLAKDSKAPSAIPETGPIDKWTFLLPEEYGLPKGKSMDEYILLLLKDLPKVYEEVMKALKQMLDEDDKAASAEVDEMNKEDGDGDGDDGEGDPSPGTDGQGQGEGNGPPGKGGKGRPGKGGKGRPGKGGTPGTPSTSGDEDPSLPPGMQGQARARHDIFEAMKELFKRSTGNNHKSWNDMADKMTPEEANTMAGRMKAHARALVRSAHEQTLRARGTVPGGIEALVKSLLEDEQTPWNNIFNDIVASAIHAKIVDAMAMPNASLLPLDGIEPWPGATLDTAFNITFVTDTSGSVADVEYARACLELNGLLKNNRGVKLTYIECDAAIHKESQVDNLQPWDEEEMKAIMKRRGYGGTVYSPFFRRILNIATERDYGGIPMPEEPHPKPDLLIVYTDGGVVLNGECFPDLRPPCPIVWLLAPGCRTPPGMSNEQPDRVIEMFHIKGEYD